MLRGACRMKRLMLVGACALATAVGAAPAWAEFPYRQGGDAHDPTTFHVNQGTVPTDVGGDGNDWKFAATAEASSTPPTLNSDPMELNGVRGAHLADTSSSVHAGFETTTGRPDVTIAVLDSGIKWDDLGNILDLRNKVRLNRGELPVPNHLRTAPLDPSATCATYTNAYDANNDGVFNDMDYACDSRVSATPAGAATVRYPSYWTHPASVAGAPVFTPEEVLIAFSDGTDADGNGYVDDIAGWDFLDDDNDAYDDVQYGHGTGEALDSSAEPNNAVTEINPANPTQPEHYADQTGACPNCTVIPLRVGDSFVADVNNFAQATLYATDNNVLVVQEALGTLNHSTLGQKAIDYAYDHGVAVIASAADEAAQHHNWPSSYAHTIVVNSVKKWDSTFTPDRHSYLEFNGCTNFSTHVTLAIPSSSCSSNATGLGAGMAGLVYSAAMNASAAGRLQNDATCKLANAAADPCLITANEVRQLMASGTITPEDPNANVPLGDTSREPGLADDVNFTRPEPPSCTPVPAPGCTDPNRRFPNADAARPFANPLIRSYPAHKGFDQYYGYGRVNMVKALDAVNTGLVPPTAEITSPQWYRQIDPAQPNFDIAGQVSARGQSYKCTVEVAPGSEPDNDSDFAAVASNWCDGTTARTAAFGGVLAQVNIGDLKGRFPPNTDFTGPEKAPGAPNFNNRPHPETYGFTVRVVVRSVQGSGPTQKTLTGQDRRNFFLHRDKDLLPGFPKELGADGASSPALADLDGDNRNEVIFGTSDGDVHAIKADGSEVSGWPVHVGPLPLHTGERAFKSGAVSETASRGAVLASPAVGDIDHDGVPEVVVADFHGRLYVFDAAGGLKFQREANPAYSGKPLSPFATVRRGVRYRTQHGFFGSPVLANLDASKDGTLEIVAANMDRHVYAWSSKGALLDGFPVTVVDRSKITAIDPVTNAPTFKPLGQQGTTQENALNQGAIVDTPAVADITGDGKPEIIVGTNEEYQADFDGGFAAGSLNTASLGLLAQSGQLDLVNSRVFAIKPTGDPGGPADVGTGAFVDGWPVKVASVFGELLPVVGEGVTGSPVVATVNCASGGSGPKVGALSVAGPGYIFNPDGTSCYGESNGQPNAMSTDVPNASAGTPKYDTPVIPAVGQPAFASLDPAGVSFMAPAAGVLRALDLGLPEYQGGQDFNGAWNASTGQFHPGFPAAQSDLSFLTGPSAADVDSVPGDEVLAGTASLDLSAYNAQTGSPADPTRWPKLTSDWVVANPLIGSFGQLETDSAAHNRVIELTRAGTLFAYDTPAPACPLGSWPRFHHDNASSGDFSRDAVSPGALTDAKVLGSALTFKAPGDDLLCGNVDHYEVVTSDARISASDFGPDAAKPKATMAAPGADQSLPLDFALRRYVAVRAVDEAGNVGRLAVVDRAPSTGGGGSTGGASGGNNGGGTSGGGGTPGGPGTPAGCKDKRSPLSSISRRSLHAAGRRFSVRGHSRDRGCGRLRRVNVQISKRVHGGKCRFVTRAGRLSHRRSCKRPHVIRAKGLRGWSLRIKRRLPAGRYTLTVRALDRKGNRERKRKGNTLRFVVR